MLKSMLILCAIALSSLSYAQESDILNNKNEFGAHAGLTTGVGLSYRHWFNRTGVQLTAIPIKTDNTFFGSVGLTGLYSLKKSKYVRAYLYLGNHWLFTNEIYEEYDPTTGEYTEVDDFSKQYNIGFAPDFLLVKKLPLT